MPYQLHQLAHIFSRTGGDCHLCSRRLVANNYGRVGGRGAWEVDHHVPRARGGSDNPRNLYPAHIPCNRQKRAQSTKAARALHGKTRAPRSWVERAKVRGRNIAVGMSAGVIAGAAMGGGFAVFVAAIIGGAFGYRIDPA